MKTLKNENVHDSMRICCGSKLEIVMKVTTGISQTLRSHDWPHGRSERCHLLVVVLLLLLLLLSLTATVVAALVAAVASVAAPVVVVVVFTSVNL